MKRRYKRVIAKIGTNVLTSGGDTLDIDHIRTLVDQAASLHAEGIDVIVVTSGAVAAGRSRVALRPPRVTAVGQPLLPRRDLSDRLSYLNARNTLLALLHYRVVPIVNENDAVA